MTPTTKPDGREQATPKKVDVAMDAFRNSVGFQFMFYTHSGLSMGKAVDHVCSRAETFAESRHRDLVTSNKKLREALESIQNCGHIYKCRPCERIAAAALKEKGDTL